MKKKIKRFEEYLKENISQRDNRIYADANTLIQALIYYCNDLAEQIELLNNKEDE